MTSNVKLCRLYILFYNLPLSFPAYHILNKDLRFKYIHVGNIVLYLYDTPSSPYIISHSTCRSTPFIVCNSSRRCIERTNDEAPLSRQNPVRAAIIIYRNTATRAVPTPVTPLRAIYIAVTSLHQYHHCRENFLAGR